MIDGSGWFRDADYRRSWLHGGSMAYLFEANKLAGKEDE